MSTGTNVATRPKTPKERMQARLEALTPAIAQIAASHIEPHRMAKMALMACERTPQLYECSPKSLFMGLLQASEMGLEVGGGFNHAYLIPYKKQATLVIGYQGYIELIYRTGKVASVRAVNVFEGDDWAYDEGTTPSILHRPKLDAERTPATLLFSYAVAHMANGGPPVLRVMTRKEVDLIRARSPGSNRSDSPWVTDYLAMALKSPVRSISKLLPKSRELAQAIDVDENPDSESVSQWQAVLEQAVDAGEDTPESEGSHSTQEGA